MKQLHFLDLIRGCAALLVVMGHLRSLLFDSWNGEGNILAYFFYAITSFGHQAVMIFFVLSGFFVGGSFINDNNFLKYSIKRLSRFYVVLFPALLLTWIVDLIGINLIQNIKLYSGEGDNYVINFNSIDRLNLEYFIYNLFYLQDIFYPTFGTNGALWSLAYEFWFYFLFPLVWYILYQEKNKLKKIIGSLLIAVVLGLLHLKGMVYFFVWMLGFICYRLSTSTVLINFFNNSNFFIINNIILIFVLILSILFKNYLIDILVGFSFSIYLLNIVCAKIELHPLMKGISFNMAKFSFSMYAIHLPIAVLFCAILNEKLMFNIGGIFIYFFIIIIIIILSWLFWYIFERHHIFVYRKIYNILKGEKNG